MLAALTLVWLLAGAAAASAQDVEETKISASIDVPVNIFPEGGCSTGAQVILPVVKKAVGYRVEVLDSGNPATYTASPPFTTDDRYPGSYILGLAGLNSSAGDCSDAAQGYRDRFQLVQAYVTAPEEKGSFIEGVVRAPCQEDECTPVNGIRITAKGKGGGNTKTDTDGSYKLKVKKGSYSVSASKGLLEFDPAKKEVRVGSNDTARVNFSVRCGTGDGKGRALDRPPGSGKYGCCAPTTDPGFRPLPRSGTYVPANLPNDFSIYYSCPHNEVSASVPITGLSCDDGSQLNTGFIAETPRAKLRRRSFQFDEQYPPFPLLSDHGALASLRVQIFGGFTGKKTAAGGYFVTATRASDGVTCVSNSPKRPLVNT